MTAVESALERQLSTTIMRAGAKPEIRTLKKGKHLVEQGDQGRDLFLVLDGVLSVIIDGEVVAELGPGAILGERAVLEGGRPHRDALGGHQRPRRGRVPRPDRPRRAPRARRGSSPGDLTRGGNFVACGSPPGTSTR